MKIEKKDYIEFFMNMERKRFNDLEDIKKYLEKFFVGAEISVNFKSYQDADFFPADYEIICSIEKEETEDEYYIDLDLYFLYDRTNMLLITEYSAEEQ